MTNRYQFPAPKVKILVVIQQVVIFETFLELFNWNLKIALELLVIYWL
jgi:hypothetical protein